MTHLLFVAAFIVLTYGSNAAMAQGQDPLTTASSTALAKAENAADKSPSIYHRELAAARRAIVQAEIALKKAIEKMRNDIESNSKEIQNEQNTFNGYIASGDISYALGYQVADFDIEIAKVQERLKSAQEPPESDQKRARVAQYEREVANLKTAKVMRVRIDTIEKTRSDNATKVGQYTMSLEEAGSNLTRIDDSIQRALQTSTDLSKYTEVATWIFGALVAAVILGFFVISIRSETVRNAIFAGDSGIQFVTLFSVVIAIILFGILRILDGKELAALLGGLSGFILGKGTASVSRRETSPPQ